jgi:hypothetical protein
MSLAESGEWLDILSWKSVEAAKAATTLFQAEPMKQTKAERDE